MNKSKITITKDNIASIALLYNYITNGKTELSKHKIDKYFFDIKSEFMYPRNRFYDIEFIFSNETIAYKDFNKKKIYMPEIEYLIYNYLNKNNISDKNSFVNLSEKDLIGISVNDSGKYVISDIDSVIASFNSQPLEIVNATLNATNLNIIDVIQSRLGIEKIEKEYSGYEDICTMSEERAKKVTEQCLKDSRFNNVRIGSCYYLGMKPDHTFRVYYRANKVLDNINVSIYDKKISKR